MEIALAKLTGTFAPKKRPVKRQLTLAVSDDDADLTKRMEDMMRDPSYFSRQTLNWEDITLREDTVADNAIGIDVTNIDFSADAGLVIDLDNPEMVRELEKAFLNSDVHQATNVGDATSNLFGNSVDGHGISCVNVDPATNELPTDQVHGANTTTESVPPLIDVGNVHDHSGQSTTMPDHGSEDKAPEPILHVRLPFLISLHLR